MTSLNRLEQNVVAEAASEGDAVAVQEDAVVVDSVVDKTVVEAEAAFSEEVFRKDEAGEEQEDLILHGYALGLIKSMLELSFVCEM